MLIYDICMAVFVYGCMQSPTLSTYLCPHNTFQLRIHIIRQTFVRLHNNSNNNLNQYHQQIEEITLHFIICTEILLTPMCNIFSANKANNNNNNHKYNNSGFASILMSAFQPKCLNKKVYSLYSNARNNFDLQLHSLTGFVTPAVVGKFCE